MHRNQIIRLSFFDHRNNDYTINLVWHFYMSETENRLFQYGSAFFVGLGSVWAGYFGVHRCIPVGI